MGKRSIGLLAAAMLLGTAASAPDQHDYMVDVVIRDGGTMVGHPVLRVASAQEARIEIGERPGSLYSIALVATPVGSGAVDTRWRVDITSPAGDRSFAPRLTVQERERSAIEYGNATKPLRLEFTITPVAL